MTKKKKDKNKEDKVQSSAGATNLSEPIALLDDLGDATTAFKRCLIELFGRFDVDGDKLLNEEELKEFSRTANEDGREFDKEELDEVKEFFDWKKDGPNGGGLTLRGWIQLYVTQTGAREEDTWKDLKQLGYDSQLKLPSKDKRTTNQALQAKLELLVGLGAEMKVDAFVDLFVPLDLTSEEKTDYIERLRENDCADFLNIVEELKCCATGKGVFKIEDGGKDGPITFYFHSPQPGMERIDREVVFVCDDGDWRTEG